MADRGALPISRRDARGLLQVRKPQKHAEAGKAKTGHRGNQRGPFAKASRFLWKSKNASCDSQTRYPVLSKYGCQVHAKSRNPSKSPYQVQNLHDRLQPQFTDCSKSTRTKFFNSEPQSSLAYRHHLHSHERRFHLPGRVCLLAFTQDRWLENQSPH